MNLLYNIGTKDITKYKKLAKTLTLEELLEKMQSDYEKLELEERRVVEIKIKDAVNDIEKLSLIGILLSLATAVINNFLSDDNKKIAGIIILIIYIFIGITFVFYIRYYRICKIYLEVIEMVKESNNK